LPPAKLRAIIFDIGRVLIRVDPSRATTAFAQGISLSPQEVWSAIEKDPRWQDWQEGRLSPRDWYLHVCQHLKVTLTFEEFRQAWNDSLDPQPIQDDAFLKRLSNNYRLALLSNTDPIHIAHMEATYNFFQYFSTRIYSCVLGASKPNPLIFREALRALKVRAEESVFIDDIPAYVEAARSLGMGGIPFVSPQQLKRDLSALGVDLT
jgi:putative hydrolase of the HAD superfamily